MIDTTRSTHNQEIVNSYATGYNKGKLDSKIEFIEKACEYLEANFPDIENVGGWYKESFINNFRNAMEE